MNKTVNTASTLQFFVMLANSKVLRDMPLRTSRIKVTTATSKRDTSLNESNQSSYYFIEVS
jgi:hypothetical protein